MIRGQRWARPWAVRTAVVGILLPNLLPVVGARGGGVRDFGDGWLLDPAATAALLKPRATIAAPEADPASSPTETSRWGWWFGAGQGRLFSLADLPQLFLEAGLRNRKARLPWCVAGSWEKLGGRFFREETNSVGLRLGHSPRLGVRFRSRRWLVEDQQIAAGLEVAVDGRLQFRLSATLRGNLTLWFQAEPRVHWHRTRGRRPLVQVEVFHRVSALGIRLEQRGDGAPVLALEFLIPLAPGLGLGLRADPETGSLGGSLVVRLGGTWLRTSHLVHPALGLTHRFHLGAGDPEASFW
jgi:hypothetical protein